MAACSPQGQSKLTREWLICRCEEPLYRLVIVPLVAFLPAPLALHVMANSSFLPFSL